MTCIVVKSGHELEFIFPDDNYTIKINLIEKGFNKNVYYSVYNAPGVYNFMMTTFEKGMTQWFLLKLYKSKSDKSDKSTMTVDFSPFIFPDRKLSTLSVMSQHPAQIGHFLCNLNSLNRFFLVKLSVDKMGCCNLVPVVEEIILEPRNISWNSLFPPWTNYTKEDLFLVETASNKNIFKFYHQGKWREKLGNLSPVAFFDRQNILLHDKDSKPILLNLETGEEGKFIPITTRMTGAIDATTLKVSGQKFYSWQHSSTKEIIFSQLIFSNQGGEEQSAEGDNYVARSVTLPSEFTVTDVSLSSDEKVVVRIMGGHFVVESFLVDFNEQTFQPLVSELFRTIDRNFMVVNTSKFRFDFSEAVKEAIINFPTFVPEDLVKIILEYCFQ